MRYTGIVLALSMVAVTSLQPAAAAGFKYLFFDDQRLFVRENLDREYGRPELLEDAVYRDPLVDTTLAGVYVFRMPDGQFHMIYQGIADAEGEASVENVAYSTRKARKLRRAFVVAAVSKDGVHFTPRQTGKDSCRETPRFPHSVSDSTWDLGELGCVVEDPAAPPQERYKALCVTAFKNEEFRHRDYLKVSGDLVHWRDFPGGCWHRVGTEPIVSCFRNHVYDCFEIICRPDCGERRVGYSETTDFRHFSEPSHCLQVDSLDRPLDELYGMPAFAYDGWYLGFPYLYGDQPQELWWKGGAGTMHCELAYSLNGRHFQRSLRTPFLCGWDEDSVRKLGYVNPILWPSSILRREDGSLLIYASAFRRDHGGLMNVRGEAAIHVYRLRKDGFIRLVSQRHKIARLATRENLWNGGELSVNLRSSGPATVAVYRVQGQERAKPRPGFSHEDCAAFRGDATDWKPRWKGGSLAPFVGQSLVFEIKFSGGELYSISGNFIPMMYVQARKYGNFGVVPDRKGW